MATNTAQDTNDANDELPLALQVVAQIRDDIFTYTAKMAEGEEVSVEHKFWQGTKLIVQVLSGHALIKAMEATAKKIEQRFYELLFGPARQSATS